jgi:hypothetical protein
MNESEILYDHESVNFLETAMTNCSYCESPLYNSYHTTKKTIKTLKGIVKVKHIVKECTNNNCVSKHLEKGGKFYAEQYLSLTLPGCTIGIDVTLFIGFHMHLKSQSMDDVQKYLYNQGIEMHRSTVFRHYERYLKFMSELSQQDREEITKEIKNNKGYILSIDAVHNNDSPLLLVCRDILSKKVLGTKLVLSENDDDVIDLLAQIKIMFGSPLAIISDMRKGISKGIENAFPDIKHQYCLLLHLEFTWEMRL